MINHRTTYILTKRYRNTVSSSTRNYISIGVSDVKEMLAFLGLFLVLVIIVITLKLKTLSRL